MISALLWDVDGTLAETERDGHRVAFNRAFEAIGLPWRWDLVGYGDLLRVTGGRERLLADMAQRHDAPTRPADREALARELHRLKNDFYAALVAEGGIGLRIGVRELVAEARAFGLKQAVVTTTSRSNVEALLSHHFGSHWHHTFELAVCGEDVSGKKPDPEAYNRALAALGLDPAAALAIEDSLAGVTAARTATVPVLVTRSVYFAHDAIEGAVAIGPGLHTRTGWLPPLPEGQLPGVDGPVTLKDLVGWHARSG